MRDKNAALYPEVVMSFASLGSYRLNTMAAVKRRLGHRLMILSGNRPPEDSIRIISPNQLTHIVLKNRFLPKSILLQNIPITTYLKRRVLVLDLNPRMPLNWLLLVLRRLGGKRTLCGDMPFLARAAKVDPTSSALACVGCPRESSPIHYRRLPTFPACTAGCRCGRRRMPFIIPNSSVMNRLLSAMHSST